MPNPRIPYQMASERQILEPPEGKPLVVHALYNRLKTTRLKTSE
tara:strand:+ start:98 stop:229 length:132 start_codon:yes stop_codon:yes gene_type:complete